MKALQKVLLNGCVAWLALTATAVQAQERKSPGRDIDAATVAAYEKLGVVYGGVWMKSGFGYMGFAAGRKNAVEGLPAFQFKSISKAQLPYVAVPFGLDLDQSEVTNEELESPLVSESSRQFAAMVAIVISRASTASRSSCLPRSSALWNARRFG